MTVQPALFYKDNIKALEIIAAKLKKNVFWLYLLRLVSFISFAGFTVLFIQYFPSYLCLSFSLFSLAWFIIALKLDNKYVEKQKLIENKIQINTFETEVLQHKFSNREDGLNYNHINPQLADDFEIFGKGSLFQYLNRCSTHMGKYKFAEGLSTPSLDTDITFKKQEAIRELSEDIGFVQDFQAHGMLIKEFGNEIDNLNKWLNIPIENLKVIRVARVLLSLLIFTWIAFVIAGILSVNTISVPILINLIVVGFNNKRISKAHSHLDKSAKTFEKYWRLILLIESKDFSSSFLNHIKNRLANGKTSAGISLRILFRLLNRFDVRNNVMASFFLNTLLLYDLKTYYQLNKWKKDYKDEVMNWIDAISDIDSLMSFSTYAFNNQNTTTYPILSDESFKLEAVGLGHPIIPDNERVCNDFSFSNKPHAIIITGANMAGKSTFLRTLAANLILAMNGAPVCAKRFCFTPITILSAIKVQDSLSNHESYFYAELLRLKTIIQQVNQHPNALVILDEILRGTNSADKQKGTIAYLKKLIALNSFVIIATHDLTIGQLENEYPGIVHNNCFEVELNQNKLSFDYKLKSGISKKLNASFLMKQMDIIDD